MFFVCLETFFLAEEREEEEVEEEEEAEKKKKENWCNLNGESPAMSCTNERLHFLFSLLSLP